MEFLRCFPIDDGVRAKILFRQWFGCRDEGGGNNGGEYNKRANERSAVCGFFQVSHSRRDTASFQRRVNLIARDIFHPDDATVKLYHDFCTPGLLLHAADKKVALF